MEVPELLIKQIIQGNCVLFAGAGLSISAGLPCWQTLLKRMIDWSGAHSVDVSDQDELHKYIREGDLLLVADEMRERMGDHNFREFMADVFLRDAGAKPTETQMLLTKIPFSSIITSNYDKLIETAYAISNGSVPHVFTQEDYPELSASLRTEDFHVLKLHGTIDRIQTIVLGRSDYRRVMQANPAYRQYLNTLFSTKTVFFLGFGFTDPDLLLLLDELRITFESYASKHYALMNSVDTPRIKQRRFEKDYGINIIPYAPSSHEHPEVLMFLNTLFERVTESKAKTSAVPKRTTPVEELTSEVRTLLQSIRYKVGEPKKYDGSSFEMIAALDEGTVMQRVLVRCIDGEITAKDVAIMRGILTVDTPQGWLITDQRVSPEATKRAAEEVSLQVFNLTDFLQQMIWGPYFDSLKSLVEENRIPDLYVDLGCYKLVLDDDGKITGRDTHSSLDYYIDAWTNERGKVHISVLGDFGAGKTWFCRRYAYKQLLRYLKDPAKERLPLLITLRAFAKAMTAQQLINDALLEQYKLPFIGSAYSVFQEMNRRGKLLLILDGFDEMARQADYQTVVDNFWELAKLVEDRSKVILTSRTEYFRWAKESEKILGGGELGRRTIVLEPPKFEVLYVEQLSHEQIREIITRRIEPEKLSSIKDPDFVGPTAADRILHTKNLAEMARKPVLIDLLLAALNEVDAEVLNNPAQVYLYATNKLLLRNISADKTFTSTADKLFFLCELAWEMIRSGELRIHYSSIPDRIRAYFGDRINDQHVLDTWDYDLRNQTLLHRDASGYYEFAHKSLAEYFVALKFASEIDCIDPAFSQTYREVNGQPCRVPIQVKDVISLAETFGWLPIFDEQLRAVQSLLIGIMGDVAKRRLWDIVGATRGKTADQIKYTGGNAATLLRRLGESFTEKYLSGTVLTGAVLGDAASKVEFNDDSPELFNYFYNWRNLSEKADLRKTDLSNATLHRVSLIEANFQHSNLTDAILDEGSLSGADLRDAKGITRRFLEFISPPIPKHTLSGRETEIKNISEFLLNENGPPVMLVTGEYGAGKTTLISYFARGASAAPFNREVLWYTGFRTRISSPFRRRDLYELMQYDYGNFYRQLATFLVVVGYQNVAEVLLNKIDTVKDTIKVNQVLTDRETLSIILPAFEKEKWFLCFDDVNFDEFESLFDFLSRRALKTRVIASSWKPKPESLENTEVLPLTPFRST